ncbi:MAG: chromate efflux transporter [Planctomycetales bacterium]
MSSEVCPETGKITFSEALRVWVRIAALSFGGPSGQIAVMHRILVEEKRWLSEERFLHALNYCMLLPGPEAQQLVTYTGWLLFKIRGGLIAGSLFVLPGFLSILVMSFIYTTWQHVPAVEGLFYGLKAAVLAVVIEALIRIGKRALKTRMMLVIAGFAFLAIFVLRIPFPAIILTAGVLGWLGGKIWPAQFHPPAPKKSAQQDFGEGLLDRQISSDPYFQPNLMRAVRIFIVSAFLWVLPFACLVPWLGWDHVLVQQELFFSRAALVTFGGAYAVLPYVAQQAVERYHWLTAGEMLDGLGLAETTPGPLIQVVQFVAYLGAVRNPAPFSPLMAALLASFLTTWATYVPCFLYIFTGAPYVEALRKNKSWSAALTCITAAVVGVVLNLALWFALRTLFGQVHDLNWGMVQITVPDVRTLDPWMLVLMLGAAYAMLWRHVGMIPTLLVSSLLGLLFRGLLVRFF